MPKMKTRKAVASRFKVTASGKLRYNRPGRRHILTKKSPKRKRQLRCPGLISQTQEGVYKRMMGA